MVSLREELGGSERLNTVSGTMILGLSPGAHKPESTDSGFLVPKRGKGIPLPRHFAFGGG